MKKILFIFISAMLAIVAAAVIAEAAFRIYGLFDRNRTLRNSMGDVNKKYHHAFKPNTRARLISSKPGEFDVAISINNYGFRGRDIALDKRPGTFRIMAIGDSFTFGVGAEDDQTIPALIEKGLREKNIDAEVINAGFGNYSPLLHYLRLRDEYMEFKPDLVLLFYDFTDIADDWRFEKSLIYDKAGNITRCDLNYTNGKLDWWVIARSHSRLCSRIHDKLIRTYEKIRILGLKNYVKAKLEGKRAKALIVSKEKKYYDAHDPIEYDEYLMIRGRERLPYIEEHFKRSEKYLDKIKDLLDAHGIPMILIIYPYGIHVGPYQWGEGRIFWGFEKGKVYDDYYAFDILKDYAKRKDIAMISLLPAFLQNKEKRLFFDFDGHFTPEANRVAAQAILSDEAWETGPINLTRGDLSGILSLNYTKGVICENTG